MEWSELPETVRREALQRAKRGEHHPDPAVAAAAYARATGQPVSRVGQVVDLAVDLVSGLLSPGSSDAKEMRESATAHRLMKLGAPPPRHQ